jgi:hypothetical protein
MVEGCTIDESSPLNKSQPASILLFEENVAKPVKSTPKSKAAPTNFLNSK